ncbi:MAG: hypothetical protein KDD06_03725 [Phaeodactylibacter sp.]|nr:hypothetical protein [Phaeodactylibacter sp.]MCB9264743.1 hypothetical protein [Lewinellaceae bacterium]MCB9287760.1 hypothetical protein [Lewinellaceae bacterium]
MPIEIKELHIKATLQEDTPGQQEASAQSNTLDEDKEQKIINACVDKVLDILRNKNER